MNHITLEEVLSPQQIKKALDLYMSTPDHAFAKTVCEQVTRPALAQINKATGQDNDPMYWAYALQYIFNRKVKP